MKILNEKVDMLKNDLINSIQELIKVKSVMGDEEPGFPYGRGPAKALETALNIAEKLGFKTVNIDNHVGYAEFGEGDDYIAALGHVDVVPEGDGWKHPPYGAEIHDGVMYGRGTLDDKGPIMSALYGLKAIKESEIKINKKIRIIFGTNEETGSKELKFYLEKEKPPIAGFTPDAMYPVINGEKGIFHCRLIKEFMGNEEGVIIKKLQGGNAPNMVPDKCTAELEFEDSDDIVNKIILFNKENSENIEFAKTEKNIILIFSHGSSAHGSTPWKGKNAIVTMANFLITLDIRDKGKKELLELIANKISREFNGDSLGLYLNDEPSGDLSLNLGIINFGEKKGEIFLDLRYPVTKLLDDLIKPLEKVCKLNRLEIVKMVHHEPLYYDENLPLIKILKKVYTENYDGVSENDPSTISIGGGTYAKEMPNIVAFGALFPGEKDTMHQPDECVKIDNIILNAKIFAHALYELAK